MAVIISGSRKGELFQVVDITGVLAVNQKQQVVKLSMIMVDAAEKAVIVAKFANTKTFRYYDFHTFKNTGVFRKSAYARMQE